MSLWTLLLIGGAVLVVLVGVVAILAYPKDNSF